MKTRRRKGNIIMTLPTDSDGKMVWDKEMLKHIAVDIFQKLYYEDGNAQPW